MVSRLAAMLALAGLAGVVGLGLCSCNTIEGAGKDVSAAGQTVADWAADANPSSN